MTPAEGGDDDVLETKPELRRGVEPPAPVAKSQLPAVTQRSLPSIGVYEQLVSEELETQAGRKSSLEQRGLAVITTSGVLATLLFGLGALSTKAHATFTLTSGARWPLAVALVLFFLAAALALATNVPLHYESITGDAIDAQLRGELDDGEEAVTRRRLALTRVKELRDAKNKNSMKARLLFAAMCFEVLGVAAVAVAVWIVVSP